MVAAQQLWQVHASAVVDQIAGTAQIRGYVVMKDAATNDGSLVFMQESPAQTF